MKKQKEIVTQLGKILLILLMIFSQVNAPIVAFAEELEPQISTEEKQPEENSQQEENPTKEEKQPEENSQQEENPTKEEEKQPEENSQQEENTSTPEEISPPEETVKYIITVNGEEVTSYNVEDENKTITIVQKYDGEEGTYKFSNGKETEEIDFSTKLYGSYKYSYSVLTNNDEIIDTKEITINNEGENNEILEKFIQKATIENEDITLNEVKKNLTAEDVLSYFDKESLKNQYDAEIVIQDQNGNTLENGEQISSDTKIVLTNGIVTKIYNIKVSGDLTNDNVLNIDDAKSIIDKILNEDEKDENGNPLYKITDATNPLYITGSWQEPKEVSDTLTISLENKTEIYVDDELEVTVYISGFEKDVLNGIEGIINYNKEILELENVEIKSIYGDVKKENNIGKFAYLLDNYNSEDVFMTIKFKAISAGEANISIDEIAGSYLGTKVNLEDSISTTVNVLEYGKGGDDDQEETAPQTTPTSPTSTSTTPAISSASTYSTVNTPYIRRVALSSDSLIKLLEIKGYEIDFDPNKHEYSIKVKNNVTSLDLNIILNDSNATYEVRGNENFKVGENTVEIIVTAEDESTSTYTIKVDREKEKKTKEEEEEKENSTSSKAIIIVLIILVIIGLIYVIFKDDEEDKKEK